MLLVVGLGNPGRRYSEHRHNVGFRVLDELGVLPSAEPWRSKFSGEVSRLRLEGADLLLLKPQTYMNESGRSVQPAAAFFRIAAPDVIVIHDEVDLPFGTVRLKHGGGLAGHKGLRSIARQLGRQDFGRIRVGVGRPPVGFQGAMADYVLAPFEAREREELPEILKTGARSVLDIAAHGFAAAMKIRNTRPSKKRHRSSESPPPNGASAGQPGRRSQPAGGSDPP